MIGMHRDELSALEKDFLDALNFVHDGLKPPHVRWQVRRTLRKILVILSEEASIHNYSFTVPTSIVPIASQLLEDLREKLADNNSQLCYADRERARDVISRTGYDLSQALSTRTMTAVGQVCDRVIPKGVEYSIMFVVRGCAEVYVDNADLVESLSVSLNASLKKNRVASTAIVCYAENGSPFTEISCGCRRTKCAHPTPAKLLNEVPSAEQLGLQSAIGAGHETVQDTSHQVEHAP
jgi:hypothetical protein